MTHNPCSKCEPRYIDLGKMSKEQVAARAIRDLPDIWRRDATENGCKLSPSAQAEAQMFEKFADLFDAEYAVATMRRCRPWSGTSPCNATSRRPPSSLARPRTLATINTRTRVPESSTSAKAA